MARKVKELRDLEIDEISLVDKGANQHARTVIAKRHDEEDTMDEYFDEAGKPVDVASLTLGDVVYDAEGNAFEVEANEDDEQASEFTDKKELAGAGVSKSDENPFRREVAKSASTPSVSTLREQLSKAMTDDARDDVIAKAFDQLGEFEKVAKAAQESAEAERQLRLDREYTEVAKNYSVGIAPEELGPVLKRCAETLSEADCKVIAKALDSASAANDLFEEVGKSGAGSNSDVFRQVDAFLDEQVSKGDGTREAAVSKVFEDNPDAYDEYLAERQGR